MENNNNNAEQEQWLPVPDEPYNKSFAISNFGRVKNINTDKIKSQMKNESTGYYSIRLDVGKKAKKITYQIHQLVAKLFIGECPNKFVVTHIDGNRTNNKASNLKYMSLTDAMARYNNKEKKLVSENKTDTKKLDINKLLSDANLEITKTLDNNIPNRQSDKKIKLNKKTNRELDNKNIKVSDSVLEDKLNLNNESLDIHKYIQQIKNYPQYLIDKMGNVYIAETMSIRKGVSNQNGYIRVMLSKKCKTKNFYVHRLVADAFIPNPKNLPYVNHKDANRKNNSVENLEWCSSQQNMLHDSKLRKTGKRLQAFTMDGKFVKEYESIKAAGRELKVDSTSITKAVSGANGRTTAGGYIWKYADVSDDEIDNDTEQSKSESESEPEQNKKIEVKPVKKIKSKSVSKKSETESESESESESKSDSEDNSESDNNESDKPKISSKIIDKVKKTDRYRKKQNNN